MPNRVQPRPGRKLVLVAKSKIRWVSAPQRWRSDRWSMVTGFRKRRRRRPPVPMCTVMYHSSLQRPTPKCCGLCAHLFRGRERQSFGGSLGDQCRCRSPAQAAGLGRPPAAFSPRTVADCHIGYLSLLVMWPVCHPLPALKTACYDCGSKPTSSTQRCEVAS